jgi:hypothetical protein
MAESDERPNPPGPDAVLLLVMFVVGGLLFLAFSFLTFGLPLIVAALAAAIWAYVGLMRILDRLIVRTGSRREPPL